MNQNKEPIVKIKQGLLRGEIETNYKGGKYYSFKGIPFAEPPVGKLRFKIPDFSCANKQLKPVLFFIHGGSFVEGSNSSEVYGGDFLLTQDVVLVTTNYRLGALGAIGFSDPKLDTPGNNGLKDCVASLKWIQENIISFGGDSNNVTIFGESAGAAYCHYLVLSQTTKGLFHRAIMQSGVANTTWAIAKNQPNILAKALGYNGLNNEKDIYEFLLTVPVEKLVELQDNIYETEGYDGGSVAWAPIIEVSGCPTEPNFLTKHPFDIIRSNDFNTDIPLIFGYNSDEGLLMTSRKNSTDSPQFLKDLMESKTSYEYFVPRSLGLSYGTRECQEVSDTIKKFYYGDKIPSKDNFQCFVDYCSDIFFIYPTIQAVKFHMEKSRAPIFLYRFAIDLPFSIAKRTLDIPFPGCTHIEELSYLFSNTSSESVSSDTRAEKTVYRMTKLWANFATNGNPNSISDEKDILMNFSWKPVDKINKKLYCLNIDLDVELKEGLIEDERLKFWHDLLKKCNKEFL